ncbi:hypothetical protein M0R45_014845 [Rubus argutus]
MDGVDEEEKIEDHRSSGAVEVLLHSNQAWEIQAHFKRASEFGNEIARVLEVGKHRYKRKLGGYKLLDLPLGEVMVWFMDWT